MLELKFRCGGVLTSCRRNAMFWERNFEFYIMEKNLGTLKFYVAEGKKIKINFQSDFDDEGIQYQYSYGGVVLTAPQIYKSATFPIIAKNEETVKIMFSIQEMIERGTDGNNDNILKNSSTLLIEKWT